MSFSLSFEPESIADLDNLTQTVQVRIIGKINWLKNNFEQISPLPLTANLSGFYKLRVGDYRAIYEFDRELQAIIIVRVGHRSEIY
jgi:mRNA interferase RelE/StbE